MHRAATDLASVAPPRRSRRLPVRGLTVLAAAAVAVAAAGWLLLPRLSWSSDEEGPMMHEAARADFVHDVTEKGNVESASNVEVRCEVQSMKTAGTMILEVVPEGTYVERGDFLVRLDSSLLESDRTKQQIVCAQSLAAVTQAQNTLETATINKREYLEGQYKLEEQKILSEILLAEQEDSRARENLVYSERLAAKGYITKLQLDAEKFAVRKAGNELDSAKLKLQVLQNYTKEKQLKQLESDIRTAEAQLEAKKHSHELDSEQLERIEEQIQKCVIMAPEAGQVVYANVADNRSGNAIIIEEGTLVREHQVIVRLPDPRRMQVKAKINEARISLVRRGMRASIRLDAFPDLEMAGEVAEVGDYPAPTSWHRGDVKEYETVIRIDNPPADMKPGLTAEVRIRVEDLDQVLQTPVQTIIEHGARHYCVVRNGGTWEAREVQLGPSNDKFVVVCDAVEIPVPALFEFEGRPFALLSTGPRWESRPAETAAEVGRFATVRLAGSGETARVQSVFDLDGKPVRLGFDGSQWTARPVRTDPKSQRLLPAPEATAVPVQAVFDFDGKRFCLEGNAEQWSDAREALAPKPEKSPAAADAPADEKTPPVDPAPAAVPLPPDPKPAAKDPEKPRPEAPKKLGPPVQTWTAREVTVGSDPARPGQIGVGLKAGEQVVLNAVAMREKITLPDVAAADKRKPGGAAQPGRAASKPDEKKPAGAAKADSKSPVQVFKTLDRNDDKKLAKDELPGPLQARFDDMDKNKDGGIDLTEWAAAVSALRSPISGDSRPKPPG